MSMGMLNKEQQMERQMELHKVMLGKVLGLLRRRLEQKLAPKVELDLLLQMELGLLLRTELGQLV